MFLLESSPWNKNTPKILHVSQMDANTERTWDSSIKTQKKQPIRGGANRATVYSLTFFICLSAPSQLSIFTLSDSHSLAISCKEYSSQWFFKGSKYLQNRECFHCRAKHLVSRSIKEKQFLCPYKSWKISWPKTMKQKPICA